MRDGLGERLPRVGHRAERPDRVPQLGRGVVHQPRGHGEVRRRLVAVRSAADVQLVADARERLQERVVEIGGDETPLAEGRLVLHGRLLASRLLGDGPGRLPANLATQEGDPRGGGGDRRHEPADRHGQPPRRPPVGQLHHDDVFGMPHEQTNLAHELFAPADGVQRRAEEIDLHDALDVDH